MLTYCPKMKKLQAEFKGNADSTEALTRKGDLLQRQLLQQQRILAHALDRLQQVGGQVQVVPQCLLLVLPGASDTVRELPVVCSIPPPATVSGSPTLKKT